MEKDINKLIKILIGFGYKGIKLKTLAEKINININTLYTIKSNKRISDKMYYYIITELKKNYKNEFEDILLLIERGII